MLPAVLGDGVATCSLGEVLVTGPVPPNGSTPHRVEVLVRPEQIHVDIAESAITGVPARVIDVSYFGHDA